MKKRKHTDRPERLTRSEHELSRRAFIEATGAAIVVATAIPALEAQTPAPPPAPAIAADPGVPRTTIRVTVNGTLHRVEVEDRWTLVELLRDHLGLTGTKIGCDRGECGACTVLMDGKPVYSCSQLAVWADGRVDRDGRRAGDERRAHAAAAGVRRARCAAVRLLHVRVS